MDKKLQLYHSDLFIKENVGTDEQREDLKKQILDAWKEGKGTMPGGNEGCWRSNATYVRPAWAKTKKRTTRIEKHIFYRWEQ